NRIGVIPRLTWGCLRVSLLPTRIGNRAPPHPNPLAAGEGTRGREEGSVMAPPCAIVIFGASGDLANRKLIPAIYELVHEKLLDERSYVLGFSRSEMSDEQFRMECRDGVQKFGWSKPIDESVWKALESRIYYARADYGSAEDH